MENNNKEIQGRLFIWHDAVFRAKQSLEIAFRVEHTQNSLEDIESTTFPTYYECINIYRIAVEYAIVSFSTIYNTGFGDDGKAAKSDSNFREEHLDIIINNVIQEQSDLTKFNSLKTLILKSRNEMIGHSDGQAFEVDHGEKLTRMNMTNKSWKEIDLNYWLSKLEPLRIGILEYSRNFES